MTAFTLQLVVEEELQPEDHLHLGKKRGRKKKRKRKKRLPKRVERIRNIIYIAARATTARKTREEKKKDEKKKKKKKRGNGTENSQRATIANEHF